MDKIKHRRLQELKRSDFEIVDGEPDIRGWDVFLADGSKVGTVEELIVDAQQKKVRYLVMDTKKNRLHLDDCDLLIPIGMAELDRDKDDVYLPNLHADQLRMLPHYEEDRLDHEMEQQICSVLGRAKSETVTGQSAMEPHPEFYRHDYYNDDNLYRHRLNEKKQSESEYEKGLRLWERRSEGGILPQTGESPMNESKRESRQHSMQPVRNSDSRREDGYRSGHSRKDHTIEGRIRNEGLQGPDGKMS